ncbi:MAG: DUF6065 family protein [Byssovorax sp.]
MKLEAYEVSKESILTLGPASARREWMDRTPERFANRCLPLMMANQAGWVLSLTEPVEVEWSGKDGITEIAVFGSEKVKTNVASHFGSGIITFKIPFLFRTPQGYNLLARGPANTFKDGIAPLEGLIEVDWAISPFTMNWKITRPGHRIRFEEGEPVCMLVPERRGALEKFEPVILALDDDPELAQDYREWHKSRGQFIEDLNARAEEAVKAGWQRDYFQGRLPEGGKVPQHQTKLDLRPFRRKTSMR